MTRSIKMALANIWFHVIIGSLRRWTDKAEYGTALGRRRNGFRGIRMMV
jgi:hypothetical protein